MGNSLWRISFLFGVFLSLFVSVEVSTHRQTDIHMHTQRKRERDAIYSPVERERQADLSEKV